MSNQVFSKENINGVYIPSALLIVGVAIVNKAWLPYAAAFAAIIGGFKIFASGDAQAQAKAVANGAAKGVANAADKVQDKVQEVVAKAKAPGVLKPGEFQDFPLTKITKTSHNVSIYTFGLPQQTDILGLPIGQHISLAATPKGAEKEVVRSYTPISSDEDKGFFEVMIKTYPQGNISAHMTTLKIGDTMKVRGPKGAMVYTPNMCRRIGMVAGGTGITPMLQIIRAIVRQRPRNGGNDRTKVDLIFANVNTDDILLRDQLDALDKEDEDFTVYHVLNNPPEGWTGGVGFVTADIIKAHLPAPASDIKIMLCGPPPMVSAMKKATESLGYEKARPVSKLQDQVFCF